MGLLAYNFTVICIENNAEKQTMMFKRRTITVYFVEQRSIDNPFELVKK